MPSAVFYPAALTDTGYWLGTGTFYPSGYTNVVCAFGGNAGSTENSFIRFRNVAIPAGASIISAYIRFKAWAANSTNTCYVNIRGELAANSSVPSSYADATGRTKSDPVSWNPTAWTTGASYNSPDISSILSEIVLLEGWNSGNALQIYVIDNGSVNGSRKLFDAFGYGSGYPELHVEWVETVSIPGVSLSLGANAPMIPLALPQTVGLLIAANAPTCSAGASVPGAPAALGSNPPGFYSKVAPPSAGLSLFAGRPSTLWTMPADQLPTCQIVYTLTLTGDTDELDDIVIPMSSFSTRLTADATHYLSATVPNSRAWADAISARAGGDLVVKKGLRRSEYALRLAMERYEAAAQVEAAMFRASTFGGWLESMAAQTFFSTAALLEQWLVPAYATWGDLVTPSMRYMLYGWQSATDYIAWYVANGYAGTTALDWSAAVALLQTPSWLSAVTGGYYTSWRQLCGLDGGDPYVSADIMALTADKLARMAEFSAIETSPDDWMGGGQIMAEIARVPFSGLSWERGGVGDSAIVTGQTTVAVVATKSIEVTGIQYEALDSGGKRRLRCEVSLFLAPGDVATWGDQSMIVGQISHSVGPDTAYMEVMEQ